MSHRFLVATITMSAVLLFAPMTLAQNTWVVDATGAGDFTEIDPAIQAAVAGDLVLVRDTGVYLGFTVDRAVVVKASTSPFELDFDETVDVQNVAGGLAGVSGAEMHGLITVSNCQAEVILENLDIQVSLFAVVDQTSVRIVDSTNVSIDGLLVQPGFAPFCSGTCVGTSAGVEIIRSRARLNQVNVTGPEGSAPSGLGDDGLDGGAGILADSSIVTIANADVLGGTGGVGGGAPGFVATSGDGGPGVHVKKSFVTVLGTASHVIEGGMGGPDDPFGWNQDGAGAPGILVDNHRVDLSRVVTVGGFNGAGTVQQPAEVGNVIRQDVMAVLTLTNGLSVGGAYTLTLDGIEPGNGVLVFSDTGGWWRLGSYVGPDLSALPGGLFGVLPLGRTDALGDLMKTVQISPDPTQVGQNWVFQAALFGDSGVKYLTNAATRIIGE